MINIQNIGDNECCKCCLVRYLHRADPNPVRIAKADKDFAKKTLDFKGIKFPVKIRDTCKIGREKREFFWYYCLCFYGYEDNKKYTIYVSKNVVKIKMLIYY